MTLSKSPYLTINKENFLIYLLTFSLFLTQFYIWRSGLPQPSHIVALLSVIYSAIYYRSFSTTPLNTLNLFIIYVVITNLVWFFINGFDATYIWSTSYWLFNYFFLIALINLKKISFFKKSILVIITFSIILELIIWLLDLGRYKFPPRYNALFNDPNQMAFWILCSSSIYLLLSRNKILSIFVFITSIFLILNTLSRSALLGIPFLTLGLILKQNGSFKNKLLITLFLFTVTSVSIYLLYSQGYFDSIIDRFLLGLRQRDSQEADRGFNVIYDYPQHLFFGAGQGAYYLYTPNGLEVHSTWIGLLFYYGVFGSSLFILFLYQIIKNLKLSDKFLVLAPMLYSFTTYGARNTIFWFLVACIILTHQLNKKNK